jgi:hypothetical protein
MTLDSITSLLSVLDATLRQASKLAADAHAAARHAEQNQAIGTLLPAEPLCEDALAILRVVLSLHRNQSTFSEPGPL